MDKERLALEELSPEQQAPTETKDPKLLKSLTELRPAGEQDQGPERACMCRCDCDPWDPISAKASFSLGKLFAKLDD
ncbi:MAG: hypothetical protein ABSD98_05645 [Candidatus Korobacteraceae bacterium]|jgi:hypothetical protein